MVRETVNGVLATLRDAELKTEEKRTRILERLEPVLDFALMAQLSIGPRFST